MINYKMWLYHIWTEIFNLISSATESKILIIPKSMGKKIEIKKQQQKIQPFVVNRLFF